MQALTNTEEMVMNCIWKLGKDVEVIDVMQLLKDKYHKEYARTTVCVFMSFLRDKEYVSYVRKGHTYVYNVLVSREQYMQDQIAAMLENSFGNSLESFIQVVLSVQKPTPEEKDRIIALLQ